MNHDKATVSRDYIERMKTLHASKPHPGRHRVLLSGADRPGSIGEGIETYLHDNAIARVTRFAGDVRDSLDCDRTVSEQQFTALVMCHGTTHLDWMEDTPREKIRETFDVNLTGTLLLAQAFVRDTINFPVRKTIIMFGSMAYKSVLNGSAAYCASCRSSG